jgi:endonuclease YncB( thermonuclease family)
VAECERAPLGDRRGLAYVTVDGQEVNTLVRNGYGCVLFIPPSGASREEEFSALELDARNAPRGLWTAGSAMLPPACTPPARARVAAS